MTDSLVFAKITLQVTPSMFLLTILKAISNGDHVLGIFIDLSKAFDTIDHNILLSKLMKYGVRGQLLSLISSYLANRSQCVSILGEKSDELPVVFGVPKGSCLSPLLFLIYINDLGLSLQNHNEIILFADDTNIFVKAKSLKLAYQAANELLSQINDYMVCNKLHINLEKSCYMHFKKYIPISSRVDSLSNDMTYNIHINNSELKKVTHTKFFGVIIDENLTWEQHIKALSKKLAICTGSLNRIIQFLPKNMHKELYYTLFESYLAYGVTVWGKASKSKLRLLFKAQKKAIRVVFGNKEQFLDKFRTCAKARPYLTFITHAVKYSKFSNIGIQYQFSKNLNFQRILKSFHDYPTSLKFVYLPCQCGLELR